MGNVRDNSSNVIDMDKYYTPLPTATYCIARTRKALRGCVVSEVIEPSAGNGAFSCQLPNCLAYDIAPEHPAIKQRDYLKHEWEYKPGRLIIGNPPFGSRSALAIQFFKQSVRIADYISFILPAAFYNNTQRCYEFDLVHSELLPTITYSGRNVSTCLNIYRRPAHGLNAKPDYTVPGLHITEIKKCLGQVPPTYYDMGIIAWGTPLGGPERVDNPHAKSFYITVERDDKERVLELIRDADWGSLYPMTSTPNLLHWHIHKYVGENL